MNGTELFTAQNKLPELTSSTSMKKRYLIGLVAASFGIGFVVTDPQYVAKQNAQREEMNARDQQFTEEMEAWKAERTKRDAELAELERKRFAITPEQRTRCRLAIQQAMHDPRSFRWEGSMSDMRRTGILKYSGTNAFGGRVQQRYLCQ